MHDAYVRQDDARAAVQLPSTPSNAMVSLPSRYVIRKRRDERFEKRRVFSQLPRHGLHQQMIRLGVCCRRSRVNRDSKWRDVIIKGLDHREIALRAVDVHLLAIETADLAFMGLPCYRQKTWLQ
jgi:hypothetical protein